MRLEEALGFIFVFIICAYSFALLFLNSKVQPGPKKLPDRYMPVKFAVNAVGSMFLMLFVLIIGLMCWFLITA